MTIESKHAERVSSSDPASMEECRLSVGVSFENEPRDSAGSTLPAPLDAFRTEDACRPLEGDDGRLRWVDVCQHAGGHKSLGVGRVDGRKASTGPVFHVGRGTEQDTADLMIAYEILGRGSSPEVDELCWRHGAPALRAHLRPAT